MMLAALVGCSYSVEMAKIRNNSGRTLTSSTLEWVDLQTGQTPPAEALPISKDGPVWCRGKRHGIWVPGAVIDGQCHMPFLNQVFKVKEYDVLVSINDSARIINKEWDHLRAVPANGITSSKMVLAIAKTDEDEVLPGYVDPQKREASLLKDGKHLLQKDAFILTEDEPERYEVDQVVRDEEHSLTTTEEKVVATVTLENPDEEEKLVSEMVDYVAKEVIYWGRIRGTITSLTATVMDPSGNVKDITWGNENELDNLEQQQVEFELPAAAGVNVTLIAIIHKYEAPYSAKLTAVYEDGERRTRTISGLHIHVRMAELRANFSKPFYLSNNSEIEGEFVTSEILMHSTTTTTTTTTIAPPDAESTSDKEKPHSESLASGEGEGKLTTGEHDDVNDHASTTVPGLVSLCCSLLVAYHLTLRQ